MLSIIIRILLAITIGGTLGIERERLNRPAGFRTYVLVCLGSTLVMTTNQYVFQYFSVADPVRMGAQVVSGIGFLGAGTILVTGKNQVRGMTTAASLWAAACCGLAIGIGFYEGAIAGGIAILLVMAVLQRVEASIHSFSKIMELYLEIDESTAFSEFIRYARSYDIDIFDIQIRKNKTIAPDVTTVILTARNKNKQMQKHEDIIELLSRAPGVRYLEELQ